MQPTISSQQLAAIHQGGRSKSPSRCSR